MLHHKQLSNSRPMKKTAAAASLREKDRNRAKKEASALV